LQNIVLLGLVCLHSSCILKHLPLPTQERLIPFQPLCGISSFSLSVGSIDIGLDTFPSIPQLLRLIVFNYLLYR
jgi:hypothetical protein